MYLWVLTEEKLKKSDDCIYDHFTYVPFLLLLFFEFLIRDSVRILFLLFRFILARIFVFSEAHFTPLPDFNMSKLYHLIMKNVKGMGHGDRFLVPYCTFPEK